MQFTELKKSLKTKTLNAYLLTGEDAFLLNKSFQLIKGSLNLEPEYLNFTIFNSDIDFKLVVKALETLPVVCEKKLVYVNRSVKDGEMLNLDYLVKYLNNPSPYSVLVINAGSNKVDFAPVIGKIELVNCNKLSDYYVTAYVKNELKSYNKTITDSAMKLLMEYCLYDLMSVNSELVKLVSYIGTRTEIEKPDVENIVNKSIEYQLFNLTEFLAHKKSDKVYELLTQLKAKKENDKILFPLLQSFFRRMLHISLSSNNTKSLSSLLKVKEFAVIKTQALTKLFSQKQLKYINDLCLTYEYSVKSGEMLNDNAVDLLILNILNL